MILAADVVILDGGHGRLLGVDHLQVLDFALAALGAHHLGQRADRGLVDIGHFKAGRVHLVACAHGADDGGACLLALHHKGQLAGDGVNGIHHIVVLGKVELVLCFRAKEAPVGGHPDVRVNVVDALCSHIYFILPYRTAGGDDLAVEVGQADLIIINQIQCPHAAARQRFHRVAAHAADAEHRHAGIVQFFHSFRAQQQLRAGILILHFVLLVTFPLS